MIFRICWLVCIGYIFVSFVLCILLRMVCSNRLLCCCFFFRLCRKLMVELLFSFFVLLVNCVNVLECCLYFFIVFWNSFFREFSFLLGILMVLMMGVVLIFFIKLNMCIIWVILFCVWMWRKVVVLFRFCLEY